MREGRTRAGARSNPVRPLTTAFGLIAVGLLALIAGIACGVGDGPGNVGASGDLNANPDGLHGTVLDPPEPAPDFTLTDQRGQTFTLSERKGKAVLLFFGYTHCPDVCPTTMVEFTRVRDALASRGLADKAEFVFITVDPERDTQEVLAAYVDRFSPSFTALGGDEDALEAVKAQYGVASGKEEQEEQHEAGHDDYSVFHSAYSFLIDPAGDWRALYSYGTPAADMAEDIVALVS